MSRAYSKPHIPHLGLRHQGLFPWAVFQAKLSVALELELQYTCEPGSFDPKGGGRVKSAVGLLSYPMCDHLKTSIGRQPAISPPSAGEKSWTRGGL
jgi:hypothetical protein